MQDRKVREGESVEAWIARLPSPQREVLAELRGMVTSEAPHLKEEVKWSAPWYSGRAGVFYLGVQARYATFGVCRGAHLADPHGLLEGTGKDMRHVKVPSFDAVSREQLLALLALLAEAVAYDAKA